jgi:hypothetical protein
VSRPDFNRYAARDGKLFEITARDPEQTREIKLDRTPNGQSHLTVRMAAELNAAHAHGFELFRYRLRRLIGL